MYRLKHHAHIIQHPFTPFLQGALLDSYTGQPGSITLSIRAFKPRSLKLLERDGKMIESVRGDFFPIRLCFSGVTELKGDAFFNALHKLPAESPDRIMSDLLSWRQPGRTDDFYLLWMRAKEADDLQFFAYRVTCEQLRAKSLPAAFERDYSPAPPMPDRLVPRPQGIHRRFGGDPVAIHLDGKPFHHRLFIGGVDVQPDHRPNVDAVLNLGEDPSRWADTSASDRWINKGEGSQGMGLEEIRCEAEWVIQRLHLGHRVLVHCQAGMNRSTTICCAVLILLEDLTAQQALDRVREHHPWSRPDGHHWIRLKWLASKKM